MKGRSGSDERAHRGGAREQRHPISRHRARLEIDRPRFFPAPEPGARRAVVTGNPRGAMA